MFLGPSANLSALVGFIYFVVGIIGVLLIVSLIGLWQVFKKAGIAGWKAVIPIYNLAVILRLGDNYGAWSLVTLAFLLPFIMEGVGRPASSVDVLTIPLMCSAFSVIVLGVRGLARKFNKDLGFTLGLIFLPFIFWPILGFGDAQYQVKRRNNLTPND